MSVESEAVFLEATEKYRQAVLANPAADTADLIRAAQGHVGASRQLLLISTDYAAVNAEATDPEKILELGRELNEVRTATEILAGNLPYRAPIVTAEG